MECTLPIAVDIEVSGHSDNTFRRDTNDRARAIEEGRRLNIISRLATGCDVANHKNRVDGAVPFVHLAYIIEHSLTYGTFEIRLRWAAAVGEVDIRQMEEAHEILPAVRGVKLHGSS